MQNNKNRFQIKRIPIFLIVCFVLLACSLWVVGDGVYAKYIKNGVATGAVKAKSFYFESDLLTEELSVYSASSNTTAIEFTLENFADELRVAEDPIGYTVSVTDNDGNDAVNGLLTIESLSISGTTLAGTLEGGAKNQVTVVLSGLTPGVTYTVTAVGSVGYVAELQADFTVLPNPAKVYKHVESNASEIFLTVWTENVSGGVTLSFSGNGLIPDTGMPQLAALYNLVSGNYTAFSNYVDPSGILGAYASRTYRFFKDSAYTGGDFTVTVGTTAAVDSTPY